MKKRTRSILEELNNVHGKKDTDYFIDSTANNIIESAINLLSRIHHLYEDETAYELERRFLSSIKNGDPRKFKRSIQKVIESKKLDEET